MPRYPQSRPALISRIKATLIADMGGQCAECGITYNLTIDHPYGRDWVPRKVSSYQRWLRYRREYYQGLVRLLCAECNNRIRPNRNNKPQIPLTVTDPVLQTLLQDENEPF